MINGLIKPTSGDILVDGENIRDKNLTELRRNIGYAIQGRQLANCYKSCLQLASDNGLKSIAFCCISTGEFHFPQEKAAEIAVRTVTEFLQTDTQIEKVVFNVFKQEDYNIYKRILG